MHLPPASAPPPSWLFSPQWRALPGMAYGTRQPALLGSCDVQPGHWDRQAWDQAMVALFPEQHADEIGGDDAHDVALLRRLLFWSGAVQRRCKVPVFGAVHVWRDADPGQTRRLHFATPCASLDASRLALQWVSQVALQCMQALAPVAKDVDAIAQALQPFQVPGVNTIRFLQAASALDMPWRSMVPGVIAYGQGHGCRWLESSYTDHTSVLGTRLARDKFRTAQVLRQLGFPAPTHARASSPQHAVQLAHQIGYPVVVKPADRDQGQGVSADLRDDAAVQAAFAFAARCSEHILVEKHADGADYRMTVLNGHLIKTIVRRPDGVVGDGRHTVAECIEHMRHDPARRHVRQLRGHAPLELDAEARDLLAQHGMSPHTVLASGRFVALRRRANVSTGGSPELVPAHGIHPDNQRLAERAALALQLDLAGVDIIMPDVGRSWLDTGALICEINGQPQLGSRTTPHIYQQVLRELVSVPWRIPVVLVVETSGAVARQLHASTTGRQPPWGLACAHGVWDGDERLAPANANGFAAARLLGASRSVGGAVVAMTPAQLVRDGLPFDRLGLVVVAADVATDDGTQRAAFAQMWPMVLAHVAGPVVCARRLVHTVPADALHARGLALHVADDTNDLLAAAASLLLVPLRVADTAAATGASP